MKRIFLPILLLISVVLEAQVPAIYSNLSVNTEGNLVFSVADKSFPAIISQKYTLENFVADITGDSIGVNFDFNMPDFNGLMYYGLIHYNDSKHPLPVYFKEFTKINSGKSSIDILNKLSGSYDMTNWESQKAGILGYRILDSVGNMLYEGRVTFKGIGPFDVGNTIIEGPFVDQITHESAIISMDTYKASEIEISVNEKSYKSEKKSIHHEIKIDKLEPNSTYTYTIELDDIKQKYSFKTSPQPGSRTKFSFAYASDSRNGPGGGERNMYGANYYIMKKIMALANQQGAVFMQFTGDLINGYLSSVPETDLQYANWKRAIEPWAHYLPVYEGLGNHEALNHVFNIEPFSVLIDKFPFEKESAEFVFMKNFVNPENGPISEDGAIYDPDKTKTDFPSYTENVYHYNYDNIAVICLNSDYWYTPSLRYNPHSSGNLHGYIMDNQLEWLKKVLESYEINENIDHIFITMHTPAFPNGGHVHDDMWYNGNNQYRAWVAGKPLEKGIIERRDQLLDIVVNKSDKVVALLTGDEHNYCRTTISPEMPRYPETGYYAEKIELNRTIFQINNGAAGAPYYAQQKTPWSDFTDGFTTQNALVLIHVNGKSVELEVINPDTLEEIERFKLR